MVETKMKNALNVAQNIYEATKINVFENTRKQSVVDVRSMFCNLLRKDMKFTLYEVRDVFLNQGKLFNHATVHYNVKLYDNDVKSRKRELDILKSKILSKISPYYLLTSEIYSITDEAKLSELIKIVESLKQI